ncbi:MAG TPA: redoxin domain-containing protein [Candidatus Paceibacterota bacterium]|nr:redoxin domain-containing protein [Verrucomicrobiota bacterium]HRY51893.1 redoxin domain-containing protein [Candidatus Paceibacterota bacterium]HSA00503.1 redoxin domain-containing protein [Candidatus Paceibacterota bacterium]
MKRFLFAAWVGVLMGIQSDAAESVPRPLALGSRAPDFNLPGVDGRQWALGDFAKAKVLVVVFTCNHCPTAQYYEKRIKKLVTDYEARGVSLVAISPNASGAVRLDELGWSDMGDSFEEMKLRAQERGYNYPYLYDGDHEQVSRAYGPVATPHVFVFDSDRKLRYAGAIDDSERIQHVKIHYVRDAIEALLAGKQPVVSQTKVVGCSVKWSDKAGGVAGFMAKLAAEPVGLDQADIEALKALRKNESGKFRLVTFWATWCAPCVAEFDEFVTIHRMYRHRDFELVTVSINRPDEMGDVQAFLKKRQASCRNLIFASNDRNSLMNAFDTEWPGGVPFTVLIDPDGKIVHRELGSIDALAMRRAIVKFMNERKPW